MRKEVPPPRCPQQRVALSNNGGGGAAAATGIYGCTRFTAKLIAKWKLRSRRANQRPPFRHVTALPHRHPVILGLLAVELLIRHTKDSLQALSETCFFLV